MVAFYSGVTNPDYNFSWFDGAKEQKCKCGAENCRGFINKKRAMGGPSKNASPKKSPKKSDSKGNKVVAKVKRVENGRITKVLQKKVKATTKNGKVTATMVITARKKAKQPTKATSRKTIAKLLSPAKKGKEKPSPKVEKTTTLGKRKRTETPVKSKKPTKTTVKKAQVLERRIAKPKSKLQVTKTIVKKTLSPKSPAKTPVKANRVIYDSVRTRSRPRNVR